MQTIRQKAMEYAFDADVTLVAVREAFEEGAKFAQRWIPVEEELPTRAGKYLIKREVNKGEGKEWIALEKWSISKGVGYWEDYLYITQWRPIELDIEE